MAKIKKLPKPFKNKWLKALRSGDYEQGTDYLNYRHEGGTNAFCCLGVACDISGVKWKKVKNSNGLEAPSGNNGLPGYTDLPKGIFEVLNQPYKGGLEFPKWSDPTYMDAVAKMNDRGDSFNKIAAWIDKVL